MKKYLLSVDQGTTSTKVSIYDSLGNVIVTKKKYSVNICERPGYVEQNAEDIYGAVVCSINECLSASSLSVEDISGIGITNQRESTVVWDRRTGKPIYNAIIWNSMHSKEICDKWESLGYKEIVKEKTGLLLNPYFSASKLRWILDKCEYDDVSNLCFGTIDSYLCFRLSNGKEHVSDVTNASRTMLMNIHTQTWDDELLKLFDIEKSMLPRIVDTSGYKVRVEDERIVNGYKGLYVYAIVGDQQSALMGQGCIHKGDIKNTYGTGCFVLTNTGEEIVEHDKLLSTIAWRINGVVTYALEGSIFLAGGLVEWLTNNLNMINGGSSISDIDINSNGVYFVPALSGLGCPHWNSDIQGSFLGLTLASDRMNMVSSVLEAIAFSNKELIELINKSMNNSVKMINVDGGLTLNNSLIQLQANMLNIRLYKKNNNEATSLGAVLLAGLGCGVYKNIEECVAIVGEGVLVKKSENASKYKAKYNKWRKAVQLIGKF